MIAAAVLVFGSVNVDLVARVAAIARPGETVLSPSYATVCGGKGANQAVAAARVLPAGRVAMAGRVGDDGFGRLARENLAAHGVDATLVQVGAEPTGCAFVAVDVAGENAITVASGANGALSPDAIADDMLSGGSVLVLQMEVPFAASLSAARRARAAGGRVLWNFAPAPADFGADQMRALLDASDVFVGNEHETRAAARLLGCTEADAALCAGRLVAAAQRVVVLTAGARGATAFAPDGERTEAAALPVTPVDTTGAGDTFTGILAARLSGGEAFAPALRAAAVGASLSCLKLGAQAAMPTAAELEAGFRRLRADAPR